MPFGADRISAEAVVLERCSVRPARTPDADSERLREKARRGCAGPNRAVEPAFPDSGVERYRASISDVFTLSEVWLWPQPHRRVVEAVNIPPVLSRGVRRDEITKRIEALKQFHDALSQLLKLSTFSGERWSGGPAVAPKPG